MITVAPTYGRGRLKEPLSNVHPFVKFVAANNPMTYQALSTKSGVHYSTIQRWRNHGNTPLLADIQAVLMSMGYDLAIIEKETGRQVCLK